MQVELHERRGDTIPEGWGCDERGQLTPDPKKVLNGGGLVPIGGSEATGEISSVKKVPSVQRCSNCQGCFSLKHHLVAGCGMVHPFLLSLRFVVVVQLCILFFCSSCYCCCDFTSLPVVLLNSSTCVIILSNVCYYTFCLQEATKAMAWAWWWRSFAASWPELSSAKTSAPGRTPTRSPTWCVAASWFLQQDLWQKILVLNKIEPFS